MSYILLNDRSILELQGPDVHLFLQGIVTVNSEYLSFGNALYTLMLNPQGRYLFDFFLLQSDKKVLVDCFSEQKDQLIEKFKLYKMRRKVKINDVSSSYRVFVSLSQDPDLGISYTDPRHSSLGRRMLVTYEPPALPYDNYLEYEKVRITNLIPDHHDLIQNKSFPLEYKMAELNAVSFNKGCYIGQELTARMSRSGPKKSIYGIYAENLHSIANGSAIMVNNEQIGEMRSSINNIGLAWLRIEQVQKALANQDKFHTEDGREITVKASTDEIL